MRPTFRILALAAALAAVAPAAFAAQVRLNFDDLGAQAEKTGQPVDVDVLDQLQFRGAFGYGRGMLSADKDPENLDMATIKDGGFLLNKQRGQDPSDIIISLVPNFTGKAANASVFFESITFNLFTKGSASPGKPNPNKLIATGAKGEDSRDMTPGGQDFWTTQPLVFSFDPLAQVTSLRFTAGGAAFALDDMVVTLSGATDPGGNVPEPASYALVGLALLAAGAASRRSQRS